MMETTLTGIMDEQLTEELAKVAQRFRGKQVKITIQEVHDEPRSRGRKLSVPQVSPTRKKGYTFLV